MKSIGYIVPNDLLTTNPPRDGWHATVTPGDETKSLVVVEWSNPNLEAEFELLPGVMPIGDPWETPSTEVQTLLSSLPSKPVDTSVESTTSTVTTVDVTPVAETLSSALRKLAWPNARLLR